MFRKIVSNLSFSPSLVTELGFYAHRLRSEEITRRLTIIFVTLALVVESLVVFSPPESANASSVQDLIPGGVQSLSDFLIRYDKNTDNIKDIYTALGVTREEISAAKQGTINSKDSLYSVTRLSQYSPDQGETRFTFPSSEGGVEMRYISPLHLADSGAAQQKNGTKYDGWIGQSTRLGWFAIIKANASIATKGYPATITPDSSGASVPITKTITAVNLSQGINAAQAEAKAFDKISYTITLKNDSSSSIQVPLSVNVADPLEYSTLADAGGSILDTTTHTLSWGVVTLAAHASEQRVFTLQLLAHIPATPTGTSNPNSYDCTMSASFGSSSQIPVQCPPMKVAQMMLSSLPPVGSIVSFVVAIIIFGGSGYFYLRTRQLKREIRLIRHNLNTGIV